MTTSTNLKVDMTTRQRNDAVPSPDHLVGLSQTIASGRYAVSPKDVAAAIIAVRAPWLPGRSARRD